MANIAMSEIRLACHSATPPFMARLIEVELRNSGRGRIFARYVLECDTGTLLLPEPSQPSRADRLWQTTCFELFLQRSDDERYFEYNFSPSTEWALYRFSGYRKGMAEEIISRPRITCDYSDSHFALNAEFDLPEGLREGPLMLGLAAVVEESDGSISYWALTHPPGKPDFHHKDCFALELDAPRVA